MSEVFESVIKIETGESEQSVKGLKKQISDLRDHILNLEKGTDEYADAVEQLMDSQRRLDEVMSLTKKTATALDGSYDALTHKMALLKKEWKATNDEARRNELGKQIDEINDQLKEFDGTIGNFQRNVGNYPNEMGKVEASTNNAAVAAKSFQQQMSEMNESIEPTKQKFESVGKIASGLASGFAAVQGAAALLGVENEDLQQTFVKLQAAMALAQGLGGLSGLVEGVGKAQVAFQGLGDKVKAVSKTMGKTGWLAVILAIITAVTLLYQHLKKKNEQIKNGTTALKEYNKVSAQAQSSVAGEVLKVKLLDKVATDLTETTKNRNIAAKELLRLMGKEITEANVLAVQNGKLKKEVDKVTASLIKQAMAAAQMEKLTQLYKDYLDLQSQGPSAIDVGWSWLKGNVGPFGSAKKGMQTIVEDYVEDLNAAKTAYENFAKTIANNTDTDSLLASMGLLDNGDGGSGKVFDFAALAAKEIDQLERVYARKKAVQLKGVDDDKKIAEIEYALETELSQKKLGVLQNYHKKAKDGGDAYKDDVTSLSNQIYDLETANINRTADEDKRLKNLSIEETKKYYDELLAEFDRYWNEEQAKVEQQNLSNDDRNIKLLNTEIERLKDEKQVKEEYLKWLQEDEEKNKDEILSIKGELHQKGLELSQLYFNKENAERQKQINKLKADLVKLRSDYESNEFKIDTELQPSEKNNTFLQELFGSTKNQRQYEDDLFNSEQAFFDRRVNYLEQIKAKQQEILFATTDIDEQNNIKQEIANTEYEIEEAKYQKLHNLRNKDFEDEKSKQQAKVALLNASFQATSSILNSIADLYESDEENAEANAKKIKGLRIAAATIEMLQGAICYATGTNCWSNCGWY